jgi:glyoxylase-like metal-dependent hydrolase (beta-lactamase superfamily II)
MQVTSVPVTPFAQNCSLVLDEATGRVALVDPGGDRERILQALEELGGQPEKILVTHAHLDHVGLVADLADELGIPIEGPHPDDQFWIDMLPQQAQMLGLPEPRGFTPDRWLDEGEIVTVGELRFQVFHCPGHTPGHIIFHQPEEKLALVGDVLFAGSIGRTDFPRGDYRTLINAIRDKLLPLGDEITFVPGHGPRSTFGDERRSNPFIAGS